MAATRTQDYVCRGTTTGFAAFDTANSNVITSRHRRHHTGEFTKFLKKINASVPADQESTWSATTTEPGRAQPSGTGSPRSPGSKCPSPKTYSSWPNQVERWFAYLTSDLLDRGGHRGVQALDADLRAWSAEWNSDPKSFKWAKFAQQTLARLGQLITRTSSAAHQRGLRTVVSWHPPLPGPLGKGSGCMDQVGRTTTCLSISARMS